MLCNVEQLQQGKRGNDISTLAYSPKARVFFLGSQRCGFESTKAEEKRFNEFWGRCPLPCYIKERHVPTLPFLDCGFVQKLRLLPYFVLILILYMFNDCTLTMIVKSVPWGTQTGVDPTYFVDPDKDLRLKIGIQLLGSVSLLLGMHRANS